VSESTAYAPTAALNPFNVVTSPSTSTLLKTGIGFAGLAAVAVGTLGPSSAHLARYSTPPQPAPAVQPPSLPVTASPPQAPPKPPAPAPRSDLLTDGANGPAVVQVQKQLGMTADGIYGQQTHAKVVSFQQDHQLAADGVVGPQTRKALASSQSSSSQTTTYHSSSDSSSSYSSTGGFSIPTYIVMCESGGNYHALNPSTGAGGAYQIEPGTWRAYGGTGSPQNAPKAEQDAIALKIYKAEGTSPWSCAK
jgi:peptidoglycan hydrolase-like protein with peptidoglycan-binding domain